MYYILYRLDNLKVVHKDIKPLKPQDMSVYGIAEYNGEIPKNNWLTVDNIREEIETWKEKEIQYNTVKVLEPQEKYIVVYEEQPLLDEQSNPIIDEDGNPIVDEEGNPIKQQVPKRIKQVVNVEVEKEIEEEVEVEKSKTHIVCDLVAHFYPKRELTEEQKKDKQKQKLRQIREKECFTLINRGEVWYKRLTEEQKAELDAWYQSWLDVTETFIIPDRPNWLK